MQASAAPDRGVGRALGCRCRRGHALSLTHLSARCRQDEVTEARAIFAATTVAQDFEWFVVRQYSDQGAPRWRGHRNSRFTYARAVEQFLGLDQVGSVEALREPVVDRGE